MSLKQKQQSGSVCLTIELNNVKNACKTFSVSLSFLKTALRIALVNIQYNRLEVDESDFTKMQYKGIDYQSYCKKPKSSNLKKLYWAMKSCDDAIENNYLNSIYYYFVSEKNNEILEIYKLSCRHNKYDQECALVHDSAALDLATTELLQTLASLAEIPKLKCVRQEMEISYLKGTPLGYEPKLFGPIPEGDRCAAEICAKGSSVVLGKLNTGFHKLKCLGIGKVYQLNEESSVQAFELQSEHESKDVDNKQLDKNKPLPYDEFTEDFTQYTEDCNVIDLTQSEEKTLNETYLTSPVYSSTIDEHNCSCCLPSELQDNRMILLKCSACLNQYHLPCQGYIDLHSVGNNFICSFCCQKQGFEESCFVPSYRQKVCRIRYIIWHIYHFGDIPNGLMFIAESCNKALKDFKPTDQFEMNNFLQSIFKDRQFNVVQFSNNFVKFFISHK